MKKLDKRQKGASLIEYSIIILVVIISIVALTDVGNELADVFCDVKSALNSYENETILAFSRDSQSWHPNGCCIPQTLIDSEQACKDMAELFPFLGLNCPSPC